jgi:hypothetical protein
MKIMVERKGIEPSTFALRRPVTLKESTSYREIARLKRPETAMAGYEGSTRPNGVHMQNLALGLCARGAAGLAAKIGLTAQAAAAALLGLPMRSVGFWENLWNRVREWLRGRPLPESCEHGVKRGERCPQCDAW